jgi:hypothetical protein
MQSGARVRGACLTLLLVQGMAALCGAACATTELGSATSGAGGAAGQPPTERVADGSGAGAATGPGASEAGRGTALSVEDVLGRVILFITPVNGPTDVDFCALNRTITKGRDRAIIEGRSSAAEGWRRWARSERAEIVEWLGGREELAGRVTVWIRQPAGDFNEFAEGDMPVGTARHHLAAHPSSRLYEGMAEAYRTELIEPDGRTALAWAWFYTGSPDNDHLEEAAHGFRGLGVEEARSKFERDFAALLRTSRGPLFGPGTRAGIALDKSTPHGETSPTYQIARSIGGPVMYEPLGEPGNPWIGEPEWTGLILEDTFWDRLGPKSKGAQPADVAGPIARFITRPIDLTPREKWQRFCAMVQGRAYEGTGAKGERVSDEGDAQVYMPVVALYFLRDANDGLLRGYNDWRRAEKGLEPVSKDTFDSIGGVTRAINEFDGPYEERDARRGVSRRNAANEARKAAEIQKEKTEKQGE